MNVKAIEGSIDHLIAGNGDSVSTPLLSSFFCKSNNPPLSPPCSSGSSPRPSSRSTLDLSPHTSPTFFLLLLVNFPSLSSPRTSLFLLAPPNLTPSNLFNNSTPHIVPETTSDLLTRTRVPSETDHVSYRSEGDGESSSLFTCGEFRGRCGRTRRGREEVGRGGTDREA